MIRRSLITLGLLACCAVVRAQEHPFLSRFVVSDAGGTVILDWTMVMGTTCEGTRITRSLDGYTFEIIGVIDGLCGNIEAPVDYRFLDNAVPDAPIVHYRLELGFNGLSSIQRIDRSGLRDMAHRFQPSPAVDNGVLLLGVDPDSRVEVRITDLAGRMVSEFAGRGGRHPVEVSTWPAGTYVYTVLVEGRLVVGRFVVL